MKERDHLGDTVVEERVLLKLMLRN